MPHTTPPEPQTFMFADDGAVPNNARLPFVVYRRVIDLIGSCPKAGKYDLCRGSKGERTKALATIPCVPLPESDPVFGKQGALLRLWHN